MNTNYQLELDKIIKEKCTQGRPALLLHACCAPCSSYVLEYLSEFFDITLFFYNPNISSLQEYEKRADELIRLTEEMPLKNKPAVIILPHDKEAFDAAAKGLEDEPERGARCTKCFELRLLKTAEYAKAEGFNYFTTTLTISPHKNARLINEIGSEAAKLYGTQFLPGDFKKKGGFKRSTELSIEYGLYRQNYCGCDYSKR